MNDPYYQSTDYPPIEERRVPTDFGTELDNYVRRNPTIAVFVAVGAGLVAGFLVRGLRPEPTPQSRLAALLEDLEDRVRETGAPVLRKASALAAESAHALGDGVRHGEEHLEHALRKAARRLRSFW